MTYDSQADGWMMEVGGITCCDKSVSDDYSWDRWMEGQRCGSRGWCLRLMEVGISVVMRMLVMASGGDRQRGWQARK